MEHEADAVLLGKVAENRDAFAFEELYRRHATAIYGLAMHIVASPDKAAEVVQETMLRVWRNARLFDARPEHNARGWLLKIAARESLRLRRRQRNAQAAGEREIVRAGTRVVAPSSEGILEQMELHSALRGVMDSLPETQRRLLSLHYAAGMTHAEIGEALEIPRRTVSARIENAIGRLRQGLAAVGVTSIVALEQNISNVICTRYVPPAGLQSTVLQQLSNSSQRLTHTLRSAPSYAWQLGAIVAAVAVCGVVSALLLTGGQKAAGAAMPTAAVPPETPKIVPAIAPESPPELNVRWTFEDGAPKDIEVLLGEWKWTPKAFATSVRPSMTVSTDSSTIIRLPTLITADTFCLRLVGRGKKTGAAKFSCKWAKEFKLQAQDGQTWTRPVTIARPGANWSEPIEVCCYVSGKIDVHTFDGQPNGVTVYSRDFRPDQVLIVLQNWHVEEIELKRKNTGELPDKIVQLIDNAANLAKLGWARLSSDRRAADQRPGGEVFQHPSKAPVPSSGDARHTTAQ